MCILRVPLNDDLKVCHGLLVLFDHLISLCSLMDVAQVTWDPLDALSVGKDRLLELLKPTVGHA